MKSVDNISKAVTACCILHNLALKNDDYNWITIDPICDTSDLNDGYMNDSMNLPNLTGVNKRNNLASL